MLLIDSHSHLDFPQFQDDLPEVIARARKAEVKYIINIATDPQSLVRTIDLVGKYDEIYAAIGIHPHEADHTTVEDLALVESHLRHPKVVAVGEIGLDFHRNYAGKDNQRRLFRKMLALALKVNKPLVIHQRDAGEETLNIILKEGEGKLKGVFHCFSGDINFAKSVIKAGFYISFAGNLTYPKTGLIQVADALPLEKTLIETDCPYLAPQSHRGQRCEPAYLPSTGEKLAEIKKLSLEDVARTTSFNVHRLFGIGPESEGEIVYSIRNSIYINITNRCSCECVFCPRMKNPVVKGHNLKLQREPEFEEISAEMEKFSSSYYELVFCGYGEPTIRLELVKQLAKHFRQRFPRIRLDTNGHGDLINGRKIVGELVGLIDAVSVSLNAADAETYNRLNRPQFGEKAFPAMIDFICQCKQAGIKVIATIVGYPGADVKGAERLAQELGVDFRLRKYNDLG